MIDARAAELIAKLRLQPHVHLLRTTHNVHEVRSALLTREDVPELRTGDFPLALYRKGLEMRATLRATRPLVSPLNR